jgi:hypothetical protein
MQPFGTVASFCQHGKKLEMQVTHCSVISRQLHIPSTFLVYLVANQVLPAAPAAAASPTPMLTLQQATHLLAAM